MDRVYTYMRADKEILEASYKKPSLFGELFERYNKQFLKLAVQSLSSEEEAEDAVQEAFVRIYKHGKNFLTTKGNFKAWSYTILKNCVNDSLRRRYEKSAIIISDELESTLATEDTFGQYESENYINSILSKMDRVTARILKLRFVLGKSFKEIGRLVGTTSGAARVKAYRAKKEFIAIYDSFNINGK